MATRFYVLEPTFSVPGYTVWMRDRSEYVCVAGSLKGEREQNVNTMRASGQYDADDLSQLAEQIRSITRALPMMRIVYEPLIAELEEMPSDLSALKNALNRCK